MTDNTMRVWVGCLAHYNAGSLVGEWVDASEAADYVPCKNPTHEEWWCFDIENTAPWIKGECSPWEAQRVAELVADIERDGIDPAAVAAWLDASGQDRPEEWDRPTREAFEDAYRGRWDSFTDYAEEFIESTGALDSVPEDLRGYVDVAAWARDFLEPDATTEDAPEGGVYIFNL